jgi:DNA-directed RNA polymerase subunit RPC12/RpoP
MSIPTEIECGECGGTMYLDNEGADPDADEFEYTCDTCGDTQALTLDELNEDPDEVEEY